jgi:hypothetical protein
MATRDKNLLLDRPEKKSRAKARHERVATEFTKWLKKNSNASHAEVFNAFDLYCDSALLDERVNGPSGTK